ncbi:hypothetical protein MKEN_00589800 [Mycena kentingensis (nom. inval.)]|nr:hypothetical protein MKEN_00589800 [Mycena kentingensis (nom. inval.)]
MNPTPASSTKAVSPLRRFAAHTTTTCASQASVYGKCILASYTDVKQDMCKEEFALFAQCLRQAMGRKW